MTNDAIVNDDVSAEDTAAGQEQHIEAQREPSERDVRLAEIAKQHNEAIGIQLAEEEEENIDGDETDGVIEQDLPEKQEAAPSPLADLGYYQKEDGKLYTKMKINGEEREVAADQIKAYIQKDMAGDYKLQQAAERERRLQEQEQLLRQREAQIQQSLSQRPSPVDAEEAKKQAKAVLDKIWEGDNDAAAEALAEVLQRGNATVDHGRILEAAEARALSAYEQREQAKQQQEWQRSVDEGNQFLKSQHPEIYSDQRLFDLVNGETARMVQAQQVGDPEFENLTPREIIAKAAQEVQGWMDGRAQPKPSGGGTREQRKANLKPIPQGLGSVRQPKPTKEIDTSPAAVIGRMRASRAVP
ncbi:MAG: hypothetical protein WC997_15820 [Porticoccaceae bacterium]